MLSQIDLRDRIAGFDAFLPRTDALERRIRIGVGYHGKWYRSQREHWLGWIAVKAREAEGRGEDPATVAAGARWSGLNCIPMMFWLAEAAGVAPTALDRAEAAAVEAAAAKGVDCPQHGKAMRAALPWAMVERALLGSPPPDAADRAAAADAADEALERLASLRSDFRRFRRGG